MTPPLATSDQEEVEGNMSSGRTHCESVWIACNLCFSLSLCQVFLFKAKDAALEIQLVGGMAIGKFLIILYLVESVLIEGA